MLKLATVLVCLVTATAGIAQTVSVGQQVSSGGIASDGVYTSVSSFGETLVGSASDGTYTSVSGSYTTTTLAVDVESGGEPLPYTWSLAQNYPNPFNPSTTIEFSLERASRVRLQVFNILGRVVVNLHEGMLAAGPHAIVWDGRDESGESVSTGIYLYRLEAADYTQSKKMMLLK